MLTGSDVLTFRATADADEFQLDLGEPLEVESTYPRRRRPSSTSTTARTWSIARARRGGRGLRARGLLPGTPEPVEAPTTRDDFTTLGWTVTPEGEVWTMQEPFGAYTWYPVNDQPADKALYDFTIDAPDRGSASPTAR